jgi:hypothetical protein
MDIVVATHGHCFDGVASAVVFTRFFREHYREDGAFRYVACGYGVGQQTPEAVFRKGATNAILDYRFSGSPLLNWYFDHHRTAFQTPELRTEFEARRSEGRFFFDETYSSCTKLIDDVARDTFSIELGLDELVEWADRVDAARFDSAAEAVERNHPVLKLVSVVEQHGEGDFLAKIIKRLATQPLMEVAESQTVRTKYAPIEARQVEYLERVRMRGKVVGRVALVDLTEKITKTVGKFAAYAAFPDCTYSVLVGRLNSGLKIAIGYNPWSGSDRDIDISAICARHGGGGHPFVGGISLPARDVDRAVALAKEIATELNG